MSVDEKSDVRPAGDGSEAVPGLSEELKAATLSWCKEILARRLEGGQGRPEGPEFRGMRGGVFVTLKKNGELRGCIGRFDFASLLADSIYEMVVAAAFEDPRFPPLAKSELPGVDVTVSILSEPKPLASLDDVVIGRDGLYLVHPWGRGVLLPVVAVERGWSPLEFAQYTCVKAGLGKDSWKDPKARLMVFTAPAFSTDPDEN